MQRDRLEDLIHWKNKKLRYPLLVRGARQVGKTFLVEQFAKKHFDYFYEINFELQPEFKTCFDHLDPNKILTSLKAINSTPLIPGKTILFLDEIQECPNAIMALRYFKEQYPELAVIGAGSLLEFTLNKENFRMPVGRVQFFFLHPLSFREYLKAHNYHELDRILQETTLRKPLPIEIHNKLIELIREYFALGGMPAVQQAYLETQSFEECQSIQNLILNTYRRDFGKYASTKLHKYLESVFIKSPYLLGKQIKYVDIADSMRSRDVKHGIEMLEQAGILQRVYASQAIGLPLNAQINPKKFKIVLLDTGLSNRATKIDINVLLREDLITLNRGAMAEQFVGQELLAYSAFDEEPELFYWANDKPGSTAEVDYLAQVDGNILPIEVKAGKSGRLKSMHQFLEEKNFPLGIQISSQPLALRKNLLTIPIYLISEYKRLALESLTRIFNTTA